MTASGRGYALGSSAILDAAYGYIEQSPQWPIFPVDARTKRPRIKTGHDHAEHATTDPIVLADWHRRGMLDAIGMPTGAASGTVVVDADRKHDGEAKLAELEAVLDPLPRERVVRTQSGGLHVYLRHPGGGLRVRTGAGADSPLGRLLCGAAGVDVRADGGIVVLPPSLGYRWIADDGEPLPPLPVLWLAAIQGAGDLQPEPRRAAPHRASDERRWSDPTRGDAIADGNRNGTLYRRGAALHLDGATDAEVLDDLERMNAARCAPPLGAREVARIAASACRAVGSPTWTQRTWP